MQTRWKPFFYAAVAATLAVTVAIGGGCATAESPDEETEEGVSEVRAQVAGAELLGASYDAWKARFRERADAWKRIEPRTEVGRMPVASADDPSLGIDYIFIPAAARATNLVVMSSGIHGVEAPAGVLFQDTLLGDCAATSTFDRSETAILVIHAMNPSGAKYGRRFNASNVDLNRNFFDAESNGGAAFAGHRIVNQEYRDLRHLLEGGRISIIDIAAAWVRHGSDAMNKALSGQYEFPEGVYFGGHEVQPEAVAVQRLVLRVAAPFKNMAVIDMHTGLGKQGINQIMRNPLPAGASPELSSAYEREAKMLTAMFPEAECRGLCEVQGLSSAGDGEEISDAFTTTGDITQWFHDRFADKRTAGTVISVTSEIGTSSARKVLEALVDENYCHHERAACGERQYAKDVTRLRGYFNPGDRAWQENVVRASHQMCTALGRFADER
ncbi:MAG: DUF2817 domain-containing protein [Myxococcales bacterium]|nr:DUF2817 domain-containing protein [Myxococcales bacterium]